MMESWSRRCVLGSIAALAAGGLGVSPGMALGRDGLRLPQAPMRLIRRLVRELNDGNRIVVEREWLVAFAQDADGALISGRQLRADVEAPARVAAIADIERQRVTDGKFPIRLNASGLIIATGNATSEQDVAAAVRAAQEIIARQAASASEAARANQFLAQLQRAGSTMLDSMPRDLFFPNARTSHELRPVNLPDGSTGEFELTYHAAPAEGAAWLAQAERRVTTRLAGSERHSSETWRMIAA
ncbi:MAG: hypothetical protein ACO25F_01090 [Erythrobacter sp.]